MTVLEMLKNDESENGNLLFLAGVVPKLQKIGIAETYSEICGGFYNGIQEWATHHIETIITSKNKKYVGWTVIEKNDALTEHKFYIEKWVLNVDVKRDWKHAANMFRKYVRLVNVS